MNKFIPLCIPNFEGNEEKYVNEAVAQGWVSTGGAYITQLEEEMAKYLHVEKAVACQSGTAAIHLCLVQCGVGPEDGVIVPTLTFIAAVNPVKYQFAHPIFIDCDDSLCMDPKELLAFCKEQCEFTDGKLFTKEGHHHIKAMVVVHVFGNMADMEAIMDIAKTYNIRVIEDATEALGTSYTSGKYKGMYAGTIGDFGAYSYNGNKVITTGGGGLLVAKDTEEAKHLQYLSTQAKDDHIFYIHHEVGYNYRMTNVQAALGVAQMEELEEFLSRKRKNYELYKKGFENAKNISVMEFRDGTNSNKWFYSLNIDMDKLKINARELVETLSEKGVGTRLIWGLIAEQKPYVKDLRTDLSTAKYYAARILNIPSSTGITEEEIDYVIKTVKEVVEENSL